MGFLVINERAGSLRKRNRFKKKKKLLLVNLASTFILSCWQRCCCCCCCVGGGWVGLGRSKNTGTQLHVNSRFESVKNGTIKQ